MASLNRVELFSPVPLWPVGFSGFGNFTLDSSGDRLAAVFMMPESATLTHGGFRYALRTGTPPEFQISIQGVDASGNPDGTPLAEATFTPPADATWDGTWQWVEFDASYAATRGQVLAIVIEYSSGTIDASNKSAFTTHDSGVAPARPGVPYVLTDTTGSWGKNPSNTYPVYAVKSASAVFGYPLESSISTTLTSSGHRAARKLTLPAGMGGTFKAIGLRVIGANPTANDWIFGIWNAAGTALQAITLDTDVTASTTGYRTYEVFFDDAPATLLFGTPYYYGVERGATNLTLNSLGVDTANERLAFPLGAASLLSTWDGAAWTDVETAVPLVELIVSDITSGMRARFQIGL